MFAIFIFVFSIFQIILGLNVADNGSEYPGLHPYIRKLIQTFRVSIGDLKVNDYSEWADDPNATDNLSFSSTVRNVIVTITWCFWILDIYLILVVMLNLLIAQVGQIYDQIMSQGETIIYKERAQLNLKVYQNEYFFGKKHEFVALIMQTPLESSDRFNFDDFMTFSEKIKKNTQNTIDKMQNKLKNEIQNIFNIKMDVLEK